MVPCCKMYHRFSASLRAYTLAAASFLKEEPRDLALFFLYIYSFISIPFVNKEPFLQWLPRLSKNTLNPLMYVKRFEHLSLQLRGMRGEEEVFALAIG